MLTLQVDEERGPTIVQPRTTTSTVDLSRCVVDIPCPTIFNSPLKTSGNTRQPRPPARSHEAKLHPSPRIAGCTGFCFTPVGVWSREACFGVVFTSKNCANQEQNKTCRSILRKGKPSEKGERGAFVTPQGRHPAGLLRACRKRRHSCPPPLWMPALQEQPCVSSPPSGVTNSAAQLCSHTTWVDRIGHDGNRVRVAAAGHV